MAIKFTTTNKTSKYVKILCYGRSGVGKTYAIRSCPKPIIISAEKKLISLAEYDFPVIEIETRKDLKQAIKFLKTDKAKKFETACIDSISDIAESLLVSMKEGLTDPRKAYLTLQEAVSEDMRELRNLDKHLYMIAKARRFEGMDGEKFYPSMPGKVLTDALPYFYDYTICLHAEEDDEDEDVISRYFQTQPSYEYDAKGSANWKNKEPVNVQALINKAIKRKGKNGKK